MKIALLVLFFFTIISIPIVMGFSDLIVEETGEDIFGAIIPILAYGPGWILFLVKIPEENT